MLSVVVLVVISALSVGGWVLVKNGVDRQDKALLQTDESQLVLVLQTSLQNLRTELRSIAFYTINSHYSPTVFGDQAKPLLANSKNSVAIVDVSNGSPRVVMASGPDLRTGQALPSGIAAVASRAPQALTSALVRAGSKSLLVLASAPSIDPRDVAVETSEVDPTHPSPNRSGPYSHLWVDLYETKKADPAQLFATTYGPGELPKPVASAVVSLDSVDWLVQASQRSPLVGTYAEASPWIALGVGILVAIALTVAVEVLARRERHSARVVAKRTNELLEAQKVLLRNERLAALGEFARVGGHELRNPLGAAINDLYLQRLELSDRGVDTSLEYMTYAEQQIHRAVRLTEDLTAYMREREPVMSEIDVGALVAKVLETTPPPEGIEVSVDAPVQVEADETLLTQVLTNLLSNAYQATHEDGEVRVHALVSDPDVIISITDTGPGFGDDAITRAFDPFFTSKDEGTGLGLAIAKRLVELHGGSVTIANLDDGGAKVSILLPHRTTGTLP